MPNPVSRQQVCDLASSKLREAAGSIKRRKAVLGLDGFVDEIIAVVDKRLDGDRYEPVRSIAEMSRKVGLASGQSANYELVVKRRKLGGNGPIMATALAAAGMDVTYIGNLGLPSIDPVFEPLAARAKVISIGQAAHTDALEFEDGKLMLGKLTPLNEVTWDNILAKVGRETLKGYLDNAELIGMVNWTMLPHMTRIWGSLLDEIVPNSERHSRKLFIDLADPEKRKHEDIVEALKLLQRFQDQVDVILGLNLKESLEIADVLGLGSHLDDPAAIEHAAAAIREKLNLACVVIHPRRSAHAATASEVASFEGPFVKQPLISTGAGDHFNSGFCMARVLGLSLPESLCAGVATSGYYVRTAESPTIEQLADFVANLPDPQ